MGYVLPDKPDVFLSYAPDEDEVGWVSEFAQWLRIGLGRAIGRNDACELWTDLKLPANARRSAAVEEKICDCAVMIIVHSNFYLESAWCRTEMSQFLEQELTRRTGTGSPVFVVETLNVERPPALKKLDLLGKRFWYMDPLTNRVHTMGFSKAERGDSRYINQIIELSEDIAAELKSQKEEKSRVRADAGGGFQIEPLVGAVPIAPLYGANSGVQRGARSEGPPVYLAEVSDDVEDQRDEVKRYLIQAGYEVLPAKRYPEDVDGFESAVRADLDRSIVYVQLLSELSGRKLEGSERRRVIVQHELAATGSKPVLIWRSRTLDQGKLTDGAYRELVENPEVMAIDLEEFKATIVERIRKALKPTLPGKKETTGQDYLVFVNAAMDDFQLADRVSQELDRRSIGYVLPLRDGQPSVIRQDLEQNLRECDGLILVFGQADALWVKTQLLQARKIIPSRNEPLRIIAVYEGPPPPKPGDSLGIKLSNVPLRFMKCLDGPCDGEFNGFIEALRASQPS